MRSSPPRARWIARLSAAAVGLVAGCLLAAALLEGALRILHARESEKVLARHGASRDDGRPVLAFVGDSHTYGVYCDEIETLPRAVERLTRAGGGRGLRAVNLAVPGAPSWVVLEQLERALALRPAAVVARAGFNNLMQVPPEEGIPLLESLRIVKLARILAFNRKANDRRLGAGTFRLGVHGTVLDGESVRTGATTALHTLRDRTGADQRFEVVWEGKTLPFAEIAPRLRRDLEEIAARCEAAGVPCVIPTYLLGELEAPFTQIRALVLPLDGMHGARVADTAPHLRRAMARAGSGGAPPAIEEAALVRASLLFHDRHPTPLGYEVEARAIAPALARAGLIPEGADEDPIAPVERARLALPRLWQAPGKGGDLVFRVESKPRDHAILLLGSEGSGEWRGMPVPVDLTDAPASVLDGIYAGDSTPVEPATIRVPAEAFAEWRGTLRAVAVIERGASGWKQTFLTAPLAVEFGKR